VNIPRKEGHFVQNKEKMFQAVKNVTKPEGLAKDFLVVEDGEEDK
jgi:hypothetical protein